MKSTLFALGCAAAAAACRAPSLSMDIHSHAQPNLVRVTHISLDLTLDFERREVRGNQIDTYAPVLTSGDPVLVTVHALTLRW